MLKEASIKLDDTQINDVVFGKGDEPLVLIPGLSLRSIKGNGIFIAYMYHVFSKKYKVYCFDKRNDIPETATVEKFADDLSFCMKHLNISNVNIFGISQGGMIAQNLAIKYPVLVLGGKDDKIVGGQSSNETAEKLNCKIYMYEDYVHSAYEETNSL